LLTRIQPFDIRYISQPLAIDSSIVVIDVSGQLTVLTQDKTLESPSYSNIRFNR